MTGPGPRDQPPEWAARRSRLCDCRGSRPVGAVAARIDGKVAVRGAGRSRAQRHCFCPLAAGKRWGSSPLSGASAFAECAPAAFASVRPTWHGENHGKDSVIENSAGCVASSFSVLVVSMHIKT